MNANLPLRCAPGAMLLLALLLCAPGAPAAEAVRFTAKDAGGNRVDLPDARQPTLLICLLGDQPQTPQVIDALKPILTPQSGVQVVAILSGTDAPTQATRLARDGFPWRIVTDPDHAISGKLSVHAWPTTVIVSTTGATVMHLPGLPKSFANDVEAYVAFATGRIDQAALDKHLSTRETVVDSPAQMAQRHLQVAQRLLQRDLPEQALAQLREALKLQPDDPQIQEAAAEVLLTVGDTAAASELLKKLNDTSPTPRSRLLHGRLFIATKQWDQARTTLLEALRLNPDPAQAYYFLGIVYQHDAAPDKAAEAFRKAYEHTPQGRTVAPGTAKGE